VYYFRFFKFILQLISRYQIWADNVNFKSKTDLKDFSSRIKFLEDLESDLKVFNLKLNDIYFMFEKLLLSKVPVDGLKLQKSKYNKPCKLYIIYFKYIFYIFFNVCVSV